jgi:hypothetical protein
MRLLPRLRDKRVGTGPLGDGAWRRVHDRFARSVHRYQSVIDVIPSRPARIELTEIADEFVECLAVVRTACERAQAAAPSDTPEVPVGPSEVYLDIHRRMARAATLCARASESAMMARLAVRMSDENAVREHIDATRRTAKQVRELVDGALL